MAHAYPKIAYSKIGGPKAWAPGDLRPDDWRLGIPQAAVAELGRAVASLKAADAKLPAPQPTDFDLGLCADFAAKMKRHLEAGPGFVVVSRLPVEEWGIDGIRYAWWLLGSLVDRPQPQYIEGFWLYDVRWLGDWDADDEQARRLRDAEIKAHTDESLKDVGPRYTGLLWAAKARAGGNSRVSSCAFAHDLLLDERPDLLARLYEPFLFHPFRPVDPNAVHWHPVFRRTGDHVRCQFARDYIAGGAKRWDRPLDAAGAEAIEQFEAILERFALDFPMEPGEFEILDNDLITHGRSQHVDWAATKQRRHLMRLWLGTSGSPYDGPRPPL